MADATAREHVKRLGQLRANRTTWESHWEEIAERVLPRHRGQFYDANTLHRKGEKRTEKMFDATAALALDRFSAAMESMLTPRNGKWHKLTASDPNLRKERRVRMYFDDVNDILFRYRYRPRAGFSTNQHEAYISLGAFGTGAVFIDGMPDARGVRYKTCSLSNTFIATNHQGWVDTVYRPFYWTARQAVQKWGEERLSEKVLGKLTKAPDDLFQFLHVVRPRSDVDPNRVDAKGMPWESVYVEVDEKNTLEDSGFHTFPFAVSRYVTAPEEDYGRSPAMLALPAIKVLNEQKKTMLKQGHRVVDPVILAHDDGVLDTFSLRSGAINYGAMSKDGKRLVDVLPTGNLAAGQELMDSERAVINDVFLVTLFQILVETPSMTATEVLERAREKGALISPTMGRQETELLAPEIERELDILNRQGLLPEMPPELVEAEGEFEIEYDSPLSRAQRAEEASGALRSVEFALGYAGQTGDPSPLDHFDMDVITPEVMAINGVPERWRRAQADIEVVRENRLQQQQTQQAIEAAPALAGVAKAAGSAA